MSLTFMVLPSVGSSQLVSTSAFQLKLFWVEPRWVEPRPASTALTTGEIFLAMSVRHKPES
jgi:hypothetical protein